MTMQFRTSLVPTWPPLAWLARCRQDNTVEILHGPMVETTENWFGEIVWDGEYKSGDFDKTQHAFGSGGRMRENEFVFVSSSSVVDRLHWAQKDGVTWVSNSIVAIARELGLKSDTTCSRYPAIFQSICRGIKQYERVIPLVGGEVHLCYMSNLHWDGRSLQERPKSKRVLSLQGYVDYRRQLSHVITRLGQNWSDSLRSHPFAAVSSISTGYDSPAATAIAREVGLETAITIARGRSGDVDDGSIIAEHLNVPIQVVARQAWREEPDAEPKFIASDAKGEDIYFAGAAGLLKGRVLMTGYGGTRVWGIKPALNEDYQRGDQSGLSHCEARLHLGYLHLPIPFLLADQTADLRRISRMPEMMPWHVDGEYNCPLARRIVEEAGVPRTEFGMKKKAASVLLFDRNSFLSDASRKDFMAWYSTNTPTIYRWKFAIERMFQLAACLLLGAILKTAKWLYQVLGVRSLEKFANSSRLNEKANYQPMYRHLFSWALAKTQMYYERDTESESCKKNTV